MSKPWNDDVLLFVDDSSIDQDHHGLDCCCGRCNVNGKSYGCPIFDIFGYPRLGEIWLNGSESEWWEDFLDWLRMEDPWDIAWAPGEQAAIHNALLLVEAVGHEILSP